MKIAHESRLFQTNFTWFNYTTYNLRRNTSCSDSSKSVRRMTMKKIIIPVILVVIAIGVYFIFFYNKNPEAIAPEYERISPVRGSVTELVAASGSVTTSLDVEIKCKASGEIIALPFDIGDEVQEGDLLVMLDPVDEDRNIDLAQNNLYESQARYTRSLENLDLGRRDLDIARARADVDYELILARTAEVRTSTDRVAELYEMGFASKEEYDLALVELEASEAEVDAADIRFLELFADEAALELLRQDTLVASASVSSSRISLDTANQRLDDTMVSAPMDGIVTERFVQTGQIISSGISNTGGGTPVMILSDLSRLFIEARVDESDIGSVRAGQRVKISVDAFPDERFMGEVVRIAPVGVNVQSVVTFEVRIEVMSQNKGLLMPEMTADVEIVVAESIDVLTLPSRAIRTMEGRRIVTVAGGGDHPVEREVTTGLDNGQLIEIIDGLTEGDVVLVSQMEPDSMWRQDSGESSGPGRGMMGMGRH